MGRWLNGCSKTMRLFQPIENVLRLVPKHQTLSSMGATGLSHGQIYVFPSRLFGFHFLDIMEDGHSKPIRRHAPKMALCQKQETCQLNVVCQLHHGQKQTRGEHGAIGHGRVRMCLGFPDWDPCFLTPCFFDPPPCFLLTP